MITKNVRAIRRECDGCGRTVLAEEEELVLGLGGQVYEIHGGGGDGAEFWVCSRRCLAKGIIAALDRPNNPS